jgi:hypothetical protein
MLIRGENMRKELLKIKDEVRIYVAEVGKPETRRLIYSGEDLIVNAGWNALASDILGVGSIQCSYVGVGSGTNTPTVNDTNLQSPILWKLYTDRFQNGPNEVHVIAFFGGSEANGTWNEVGLRLNDNATLFARQVLATSFTKTGAYTGEVEWILSLIQG